MKRLLSGSVCALGLLAAPLMGGPLVSTSALAQQAGGLPGGASSLNETHGDWVMICAVVESETRCLVSQSQSESQSGQRVLTIELVPAAEGGGADGVLVLPFGLTLANGTALAVDEKPLAEAPLPFSTCLPIGCLVPLALDGEQVAALKAGAALTIGAEANDSAQAIAFSIPLTGFASALDRAIGLLGP